MQAQLEKDSLRDAVDALKKEMAIKVLAHKEEERRWKEEVELATRLGQQRKYAEDDDRRAKQGDVEVLRLSDIDEYMCLRTLHLAGPAGRCCCVAVRTMRSRYEYLKIRASA